MSIKVKDPSREVNNLNKVVRDWQVYQFHQIKLVSPFDGRYRVLKTNALMQMKELCQSLIGQHQKLCTQNRVTIDREKRNEK